MENPQAGDSSAGKAADSNAAAAGSGRTTPGWNGLTGHNTDDVSRLARAALQGTALFAGSTGGSAQAAAGPDGSAAAAGNLLDPLNTQQLTTDQLAAMLSTGGYTATALGSLGNASLQAADNAAALNALLLGGGLNLNQLAAQNLQLAGLGDLSALGALVGGDGQEGDEHGGGSKSAGMNVATNKQLSSRFRWVPCLFAVLCGIVPQHAVVSVSWLLCNTGCLQRKGNILQHDGHTLLPQKVAHGAKGGCVGHLRWAGGQKWRLRTKTENNIHPAAW